jgi:predicted signal transduction protein with EAL and GGDEF domain
VLIDDPDEMVKRINDLHALGVRVALDDFGSGYSNLGYLQRFPLDKLKIDRSFVAALGRSSNGGVIIQAIVALGRALGLSVLVEGVGNRAPAGSIAAGRLRRNAGLFVRKARAGQSHRQASGSGKTGRSASVRGGRGADSVTFRL